MIPAIRVTNLGKAYKRYPSKWARLGEWLTGRDRHEKHWVLRDISFEVGRGEAVGIVGANGAGKSTLLKIITGTTHSTCGDAQVSGRVAALLELGMGFHPDFSGRQNVLIAGQLQGLSAQEIESAFGEIEAFADIGDYIDQPVRTYSSGMQVRLAFAVATAVRPEVLIVDEALAVGDAAFQRKCHRRIESFIEQGTSLLFVSHDIEGVKRLCQKALYLDHGRLVAFGAAKPVCDQYETALFCGKPPAADSAPDEQGEALRESGTAIDPLLLNSREVVYGHGGAVIERVWIEDSVGQHANVLVSGDEFSVCYVVHFLQSYVDPIVAMLIKTMEGITLFGTHSRLMGRRLGEVRPDSKLLIRFRMKCHLSSGTYFLNCGITDPLDFGHFLHRRVDTLLFKVNTRPGSGHDGLANLYADLSVERL